MNILSLVRLIFLCKLFNSKICALYLFLILIIWTNLCTITIFDKFLDINCSILSACQEKFIILIIFDMSYKPIFKSLKLFLFYWFSITWYWKVLFISSNSTQIKQFNFSFLISYKYFFHKFIVLKYHNLFIFIVIITKYFFNRSSFHIIKSYIFFSYNKKFIRLINIINCKR